MYDNFFILIMKQIQQTDCFSRNMKFWILLGIHPLKVNWSFYPFYSKLIVFLFIILYDSFVSINFLFLPNNMDLFIEEMIFYFTLLSVLSKVLTYVFMKEKIRKILTLLDSDLFQPKTENEVKTITEAKLFNIKYWNIVAIFSYFTHLFHIIFPLLIHLIFSYPMVLPVSSYLFLSDGYRTKYIYYIYCYQALGIHINMVCTINIDTFFVGIMVLLIAQLDILADKLRNVASDSVDEVGSSFYPKTSNKYDLKCIRKLNESIVHYDNISKFCHLVEALFSVMVFSHFSMASGIICVCLYRLTLSAPVQYYIFLGSYMFVMIVPILVPCYFGTCIMDKSNQLSNAVYDCDWTSRSRRFKSSMILFIERANRPLTITGLKMFPLSLISFTSIMKSAYSFFNLLQQMQDEEA